VDWPNNVKRSRPVATPGATVGFPAAEGPVTDGTELDTTELDTTELDTTWPDDPADAHASLL
jgi:hypothetical protein